MQSTLKYLIFTILIFGFSSIKAQLAIQAHAGPDKSVCPGDSVQIGDNPISSYAMAPLTITWLPNSNISNNTIAQPYVWPSVTTKYYLHITDANGRSATDSVIVTAHSPSSVTLDPFPILCWRDAPVALNSGIPTGGWYKGITITDSLTFDPFNAGSGQHEITYYYSDPYCSFSDSAKAFLTVAKHPDITVELSEDTIDKGDTVIIKANGALTYLWKPSGAPFSASVGDSILAWPDSTSNFEIVGTDTNDCSDSIGFRIVVRDYSGVKNITNTGDLKIYPNPFRDRILLENSFSQEVYFEIRNVNGEIVSERAIRQTQLTIETSNWDSGWYVLRIISKNGDIIQSNPLIKADQ